MLSMIIVDLLSRMHAAWRRPLTIVETGIAYMSTRWPVDLKQENRTTIATAEWIKQSGVDHKFISIDYDVAHINTCREVLAEKGLQQYVDIHHGVAVEVLSEMNNWIDFALLDAGGGPRRAEDTLDECKEVAKHLPVWGGIIVVDDAFQPMELNKARLVWPEAASNGVLCRGVPPALVMAFGERAEAVVKGIR